MNRRAFLETAATMPAAAAQTQNPPIKPRESLKITKLQTLLVCACSVWFCTSIEVLTDEE